MGSFEKAVPAWQTARQKALRTAQNSRKSMTLARRPMTAPWSRLQAKDDESHGQDANRGLKSILKGRFSAPTGKAAAGAVPVNQVDVLTVP